MITNLGAMLSGIAAIVGVLVGLALLDIRNRLQRIEEMIGNGKPGVLMRREEAKLQHRELEHRIERLESKT